MTTYRMPATKCPGCGYEVDAATPVQGDQGRPDPGDASVCLDCGFFAVFDQELRLVPGPALETLTADERAAVQEARARVFRVNARAGRRMA